MNESRLSPASGLSAEQARAEFNRPDAVLVAEAGEVEDLSSLNMANGHFTLLAEAKDAINSVGPNAAMQGREGVRKVLVLGSLTGLRSGDLLRLSWENLHGDYISILTGKSRYKTEAIIPMHDELARFIIGPPSKGPILLNSRGKPWTDDGWKSSWQKAQPKGFDRHMHDLRGTFATRLMIGGFSDMEIAMVMGWQPERVAAIRARYVDRGRVARALAERLSVNRAVNSAETEQVTD